MKRIHTFEDYLRAYQDSVQDPESFWADIAGDYIWEKKWDRVLDWDFEKPEVKWFSGGKLNITKNCLDRHLESRGDQTAIIWEPNNPSEEVIKLSYRQLHAEVCKFSNALKSLGIQKRRQGLYLYADDT